MSVDDFNVVVNSYNKLSGANNNSLTYQFDFNSVGVKDALYALTFTFVSGNNDLDPCIYAEIQINFNSNTYQCSSTYCGAITTPHIGYTFPQVFSITEAHFQNSILDNPPKILRRPNVTNFTVNIMNPDGITPFVDASATALSNYAMVLSFTKIK